MKSNHLKNEKSPYLLQHAENPVDWYPWGDEAFQKAIRENKPIFLSIGYSTCHWCHVMERESFEDEQVAKLLNETFVNIKVDREERPDIDAVYMKVCHLLTQSGGWPLTIMMTPDKTPFFAATYIPKDRKYDRAGLLEIIPQVRRLWLEKRDEMMQAASEITIALLHRPDQRKEDIGEEVLHRAYRLLSMSYDATFGGFGRAPKFPSMQNLLFLLRYHKRTGDQQALLMAETTLKNMRCGGICDHIGFGFHRYSTDEQWIVPHFEKMLYDQAMIAIAAIELFQMTGEPFFEDVAREIFDYVLTEMTDERGGFYSAEDADSEGVEGKYYLWSEEEIRKLLTPEEAQVLIDTYKHNEDVSLHGMSDFPDDCFILHLRIPKGETSELPAKNPRMEGIRRKLYAVRNKRVHPYKDDKILTDWNGLMIAAFALGARVFNEEAYRRAAVHAVLFVTNFMQNKEGRLLHRFREGQASIAGNLDDYAFLIWGLLEIYGTTFEPFYLHKALEYHSHMVSFFRDEKDGGFFFTASDSEKLLTRPKEIYDGAIPSGNSVAFLNALKLSRITGNMELVEIAHDIYRAFRAHVNTQPVAFTFFLCGLDFDIGPVSEVIIAGQSDSSDTQLMIKALNEKYIPNKIVIFRPDDPSEANIDDVAPYISSYQSKNGRATAYVCRNYKCSLPVNDLEKMLELLKQNQRTN